MDIIEHLHKHDIKWLMLQFMDIKGFIHQVAVRNNGDYDIFERGVPKLDGSSIEGFTDISESDLSLKPDPDTLTILPWDRRMARFIVDIIDKNGEPYPKDGRYILKKVLDDLEKKGYKVYVGPELEMFIFDNIQINFSNPLSGMGYSIHSREAPWNNEGYPTHVKKGYYPIPPFDSVFEFRSKVSEILEKNFNIEIQAHHHEVAATGQVEFDIKYDLPIEIADKILTFKYVTRYIAKEMGLYVTFMPKPLYGDNGSGMHIHISLWKNNENLFYDPNDEYAELSEIGRYFIGGLLEHGKSLSVFVAPTVNSYKRLVPGYEAPVYLVWSKANRSAVVRVPMYRRMDVLKRIEFRPPDPSMNPYIGLAAIIAAGMDGIKRKIDPGDPIDTNVYRLSSDEMERMGIKMLPRDLLDAVQESMSDHEYLKPYFTSDFLETYWELKIREYKEINSYPTTPELHYYFSI